jgi:hypothetical protein
MTLPEIKTGRELRSGVPGVRLGVLLRDGRFVEPVEPVPRCANAADTVPSRTNIMQMTNLRKRVSMAASRINSDI